MADYSRFSKPLAKLIFSTSDPVAYKIHILFDGDPEVQNKTLKEYIYLKCFLCIVKMRSVTENAPESTKKVTEGIIDEIMNTLERGFQNDCFSDYKCNITELINRANYYYANVDFENGNTVCREFINSIGIENIAYFNIDIFQLNELISEASALIDATITQCSKNKPSSGCGCTSAIACFTLLIVALFIVL